MGALALTFCPCFEQGAAGIEKARQKAIDFGASFDADQLKKLADANTAVKDLGASFSAMATTLGARVAPALKTFFDAINAAATPASKLEALEETMGLLTETGNSDAVKQLQALVDVTKAQTQAMKEATAAGASAPGFLPAIAPVDVTAQKIQVGAMAKFYQDLDDATKTGGEKLIDDTNKLQAQLDELVKHGVISLSTSFNRANATDDSKALSDLLTQNAAQIQIAIKQTNAAGAAGFKGISDSAKLAEQNSAAAFKQMQSIAQTAATGIEDAFATFLLDPFDGGLKKMLASWAQLLAQMAAKAAAADIFKSLFKGTERPGGLGSFLFSLLGGGAPAGGAATDPSTAATIGFSAANGNSWTVGGSGGTDSQLVRFKATPGEKVLVQTPGQQAQSGVTINQTVNIDSRTDSAQIGQLIQQSTQYAIQQSTARVANMSRRGAFSA